MCLVLSEVGSFPMNMKYVTPLSEQSLQRSRIHSQEFGGDYDVEKDGRFT